MSEIVHIEVEAQKLSAALAQYRDVTGKTPGVVLMKQGGNLALYLRRRLGALRPPKGSIRAERLELMKQAEGRRRGSRKGLGVLVRPRIREKVLAKFGAATDIGTRQLTVQRGKNRFAYSRALAFSKAVKRMNSKGKLITDTRVKIGERRFNLQQEMVKAELNLREAGSGFLGASARYPRALKLKQQFARSKYGLYLSSLGLNAREDTLTMEWDGARSALQASAVSGLSKPRATAAMALAMRDTYQDINGYLARKLEENAKKARLA